MASAPGDVDLRLEIYEPDRPGLLRQWHRGNRRIRLRLGQIAELGHVDSVVCAYGSRCFHRFFAQQKLLFRHQMNTLCSTETRRHPLMHEILPRATSQSELFSVMFKVCFPSDFNKVQQFPNLYFLNSNLTLLVNFAIVELSVV